MNRRVLTGLDDQGRSAIVVDAPLVHSSGGAAITFMPAHPVGKGRTV